MRRILIGTAAIAATLFLPLATQAPLAQGTPSASAVSTAHARVIVKYRADSDLLRKQAMTATGKRILQTQALGDRIGIALRPGAGITERSHVVFASGVDSKTLATRIAAESDVEYAVPDMRKHIVAAPNDPFYATRAYNSSTSPTSGGPLVGQWYLKPPGPTGTAANTAPSSINAEQAWDLTTGSSSIVIADLDTGIRFDHPDFVVVAQGGNILPGYDMVAADNTTNGIDGTDFSTANDGNGRDSDASDPGDWVSASDVAANPDFTNCTVDPTSSWHGTQTAGLMGAATNNGVGIASVGHGNVKVMPVRVLGKCGGYDSDIQAGMLWAAGLAVPGVPTNTTPARVLNMSLGGSEACSAAYQDIVNQVVAAGAVIVVAAGNGDANGDGTTVGSPANCNGVIAVAAVRSAGDKVAFSDLGPEIAISAPGGNCVNTNGACLYPMMTTSNSGLTTPTPGAAGGIYTDSFNASLGTSFSTPLVTATVGLMLSVQPTLTPAEVKADLQSSAKPFPTTGGAPNQLTCVAATSTTPQDECYCPTPSLGGASLCGAGMLDAHGAVQAAMSIVQARITVGTASPTAGEAVALSSSSLVPTGQSIASYQWTITSAGTTGAAISGSSTGSSVSVLPTAAGTFAIQLTTTDAFGVVSTASTSVTVAAAVTPTTPPASSSGGGGGGALGVGWLLLLLTAVLALAAESRLQRRRAARLSESRPPSSRRH
jgi:serine protease